MKEQKKVTLIIGGGIAAYKSLELIRLLQKDALEITPILTKSASEFVTSLSLAAIARKKVYSDLFDANDESEMGHIQLSRNSDIIVVAPATANLIAKIANGLADDLASTLLLATDKKVLLAPAMNVRMWEHPATKANLKKLKEHNVQIIGPNKGDMACGEFGPGRMADPVEIQKCIMSNLTPKSLKGRKILVTSGPTREKIDPVRFLSNNSSGIQGTVIANALLRLGGKVTFITGPSSCPPPIGAKIIQIDTGKEMHRAVFLNEPYDAAICTAAVSDWYVSNFLDTKMKKGTYRTVPQLTLKENPDILSDLSKSSKRPEFIIGFAAETEEVIKNAQKKLISKGCDLMVVNAITKKNPIFGQEENKVTVLSREKIEKWPKMQKSEVADRIAQLVVKHFTEKIKKI